LVAAVVAAKAAKAEEAATVARQKAAAVATDSKIRQMHQKTVRLLSIKQRVQNGEKTVETDEERMKRFKEGLEQSLW
jgi:TolA-binding protein